MSTPNPSFTGPISVAEDLASFVADRLLIDGTDWPTVDKTIGALLASGSIHEEWGARYHNPDEGDVDTWRDTREDAERTIAARYQGVAPWRFRSSLIRRFAIVTAPEVIQ